MAKDFEHLTGNIKKVFFREDILTKKHLVAIFPIEEPKDKYVCYTIDSNGVENSLTEAQLENLILDTWRALEKDYLPFWKWIEDKKGWTLELEEDENFLIVAEKKYLIDIGWEKDRQLTLFMTDYRAQNEESLFDDEDNVEDSEKDNDEHNKENNDEEDDLPF